MQFQGQVPHEFVPHEEGTSELVLLVRATLTQSLEYCSDMPFPPKVE